MKPGPLGVKLWDLTLDDPPLEILTVPEEFPVAVVVGPVRLTAGRGKWA